MLSEKKPTGLTCCKYMSYSIKKKGLATTCLTTALDMKLAKGYTKLTESSQFCTFALWQLCIISLEAARVPAAKMNRCEAFGNAPQKIISFPQAEVKCDGVDFLE